MQAILSVMYQHQNTNSLRDTRNNTTHMVFEGVKLHDQGCRGWDYLDMLSNSTAPSSLFAVSWDFLLEGRFYARAFSDF